MNRRHFLLSATPALVGAGVAPIYLIAHRGGVVGPGRAENSEGALREAIRQGYWMAEVDLRLTRDGAIILHHDGTLMRRFGDPRRMEDLTLQEARALRGPDGDRLLDFEEAAAICKGAIRLMLDVKSNAWPPAALEAMESILRRNNLLNSCFVLGGGQVKQTLRGRSLLSLGRQDLADLLARGGEPAGYFLFELASQMDEQSLSLARRAGIPPVAAVNEFRYVMARRDVQQGAAEDVARLRGLGVTHFQIDSRYEGLFR